jgi:hypothetical protein
MEKQKPNIPKLIQYSLMRDMRTIIKTVFIKGRIIILIKLYISNFIIFKMTIKAATFGTNVPAKTASEVPSIPNLIESG